VPFMQSGAAIETATIEKAAWLDANGLKSSSVAEPKAEATQRGRAVVVPVNCSKNSQEQVR